MLFITYSARTVVDIYHMRRAERGSPNSALQSNMALYAVHTRCNIRIFTARQKVLVMTARAVPALIS